MSKTEWNPLKQRWADGLENKVRLRIGDPARLDGIVSPEELKAPDDPRVQDVRVLTDAAARLATHLRTTTVRDRIAVLELSGFASPDPWHLALLIRRVVQVGARARQKARRNPHQPVPIFAVRWSAENDAERSALRGFVAAWGAINEQGPVHRLVVPMLFDTGPQILGRLPPRLSGERHRILRHARLLTYRTLALGPVGSRGNSEKYLGKLLSEYRDLGLIVPRGYVNMRSLRDAGVNEVAPTSRPQVWESVLAALAGAPWRPESWSRRPKGREPG